MQKGQVKSHKLKHNNMKKINVKNLPTFILIGLILMIIIIAIIYYVFLRYAPEQIITYRGYAIEGQALAENLKNSDISNVKPYLDLVEVQENDLLYKRLNSYYVGEDDKKEIDINYPIYINNGDALLNIGQNTKLITVNYEEVEGYPEFMMTDGVMYNGVDLTRADGNKYIFLKSEDEIYTNVGAIKITTASNTYNIKEFSNIYFTENAITYYEMEDGYLQYKRIDDVDKNSKIEVNGESLTYKTFLERLGIIDTEENSSNDKKDNETEEANKINENTVEEPEQVNEENSIDETNEENTIEENDENNKEDEWQEGMWEKPEVSCTDFEGEVYTIRTNLSVRDRAGVITRGITFEIYLDGRLNRRVQVAQAGTLEITNLRPSSEYDIRGIFYYNDENGIEQEEEFYTGKVSTKSIDTLGTLDFSFQNGEIYSNKIELIHLKLNNNIDEEVVRGIARVQVEIGDVAYRLTNAQIDELKAGKEITYQTSENLTSNSKIKYEITAFDRFGNELKEKNNTGETITSKQAPIAEVKVLKQEETEVELEITLTNKDNVSLENYRYEITNQNGEVIKQGTLGNSGTLNNGSKEKLEYTDLDPNGYYQITIYGDYDIEDGKGMQKNKELGKASFITKPLESLGYIQVKIDDKEIKQEEMTLGISIDTMQTDAKLVAILNKVEIVIYDEGKNIEENQNEGGTSSGEGGQQTQPGQEIKRITLTDDEVEKLKAGEEIELKLKQLTSNTKYKIDIITTVKQGTIEDVVEDKQNIDQVITLKKPAEVQIRNQFVIGDMIDLDMRIEDEDGAILVDKVRIEVRDKDNKLVDLSEMQTNQEYENKVYENLEPNETYTILVYAPQYNEGSTDETYKADYLLKELKILTEAGVSGKLDLIGLEKTPSEKNLIDVSSKVNWYERCFNRGNESYGLSYDEKTKILSLGGTQNVNLQNYYDLSKYLGQEVTISFKARTQDDTSIQIIEKNVDDFNNDSYSFYYEIKDLTKDWKEYSYTVTLSKTGYIGLLISKDNTTVEIQDLQIELGNKKTDYEEFQHTYNANVEISLDDKRDEITSNDYYIRVYKNGEQVQEVRYEEIGEENKVEKVQKLYEVEPDANYKIELLVKISERYYSLDSQEFATESGKEIKGIADKNEFLKIQPYGDYIILGDIDFTGNSGYEYRFGGPNLRYEGRLNFNGYKLLKEWKNAPTATFDYIGYNGVVENLVFDLKMNNEKASGGAVTAGLVSTNYGTIRNVQINLVESNYNMNNDAWIFSYANYGTIENFVVNFEEPFYISGLGGIFGYQNYGTIKNGYIYGENIQNLNNTNVNSSSSELVAINVNNAVIENVFTLISIDNVYEEKGNARNIVNTNSGNATVQNVYSVKIGKNNTNLAGGPNVYIKNSKRVYNCYYFADEIFTGELETKGNKLSLWDATFQNQLINGDGAFIVDDLVNEGYYPWVNMPDVMPIQEYIELPEVKDADLPDILSTKVLEQGTDTVKVQFSVNNPAAEQISEIQINNIDTVEILSQEYNNGKSTVIAELKDPVICVSSYDLKKLSTKGAFGSGYTRPYAEGERVINVDLYKEIWNVNDWKAINDSITENYMLMADLDFANEGNTINIPDARGVIDGNGHTISNIYLNNNMHFIGQFNGTLKNLYVKNFNQECNDGGGLIYGLNLGAIIDNVYMTDVNILKNGSGFAGGIVRYGSSATIQNSSVSNIQITSNGIQSQMYIGGIVGYLREGTINNCYVQKMNIKDTNAVSSGIGGILGYGEGTSNINNCYTEGNIYSKNINVGGIAGRTAIANIENCYSKVNISTENNNVGGILGTYYGTDLNNILNNLSIGNIYTRSGINALNRIVGSSSNTNNNYAYENQLLNGYVNPESKGAILLNREEILNYNLGNMYNYDGKEKGILPKLYNTEGTELLPNQEDILIDNNNEENVKLEVEKIEATKPNTTEAEISININNPNEVEITGIEIEDMTVSDIERNVTQNGMTNITVIATPNRYYDTYKLTGIKYKDASGKEQIVKVEAEIKVQFYKEIYTYEDWQSIEENTFQNYRLMADIDFSGKQNIKSNISVNRLEAENNIYTLKNITLEFNTANSGLINNVKTSMKNIAFENINLTNTAGKGEYFGVITSNNGNLENIQFKDINIKATGISYVGAIGGMTSGDIHNVNIDNLDIIDGKDYLGGLIGNLNVNLNERIDKIVANNVTIQSTGNYIGGIIGQQRGDNVVIEDVTISNSNIKGTSFIGGVIGNAANGDFSKFTVNNTNIEGLDYVGGIFGRSSDWLIGNRNYMEVDSSTIKGNGNYIGGIAGYNASGFNYYWNIRNTEIIANNTNTLYVGGLVGQLEQGHVEKFQVENIQINGNASSVGGVIGNSFGSSYLGQGYVTNAEITGRQSVGGLCGDVSSLNMYSIYINAKVNASASNAGGIVGYMSNTYMEEARNIIQINQVAVLDSIVTAPTNAGGMIGNIAVNIFRDKSFYYNNYIDADVTSENSSTGSLLIGGRPDENSYLTNTYVYKYSMLNGDYVYATNDNVENEQYLIREDLDKTETLRDKVGLGTTYWNYTPIAEGKYPKINDSYLYKPESQTGIDLPTDPDISIIGDTTNKEDKNNTATPNANSTNGQNELANNGIATQSIEALPSAKVYPVSVDEVNVDFSEVPQGTSFTYYVNGQEKEKVELNKKTYTFKYNYQDKLEIKLTNGVDEETITIMPDDVRSEASLVGDNYAYLAGTNMYVEGKIRNGEYVNIYKGNALNNEGTVINISTNEIIEKDVETGLEQTETPIETYEYKGNTINTYGTYSTVNGNTKLQIYNVRSGKLSALSNNLDMKINNYISDNYNNKEYQTILSKNGEIVDLKEKLQYPGNFFSRNIKQIVQNNDQEKTEMMVLYNTGKVIVFNYVTGEVIYENDEKADEGLVDYIAGSVSNIWDNYEEKQEEYSKGKELAAKLSEMPIEEAMKQKNNNNNGTAIEMANNEQEESNTITNSADNYITVYNGNTDEYDVYSANEIIGGKEESPVSETTKIKQNGLENIYKYATKEEAKPQANGAIIVIIIIIIAVISLIVLRRIIIKNNIKKQK